MIFTQSKAKVKIECLQTKNILKSYATIEAFKLYKREKSCQTILGDSNAIVTKGLLDSMNDIADMLKDLQIDVNVTTTNNKKIESIKDFDNIATSAKRLFVEYLCRNSFSNMKNADKVFKRYLGDVVGNYVKFILALPPYVVPDSLLSELMECRKKIKQMWKNKNISSSPREEDWGDFGKVFLNSDLCIKILVHTKFDKRHENIVRYGDYECVTSSDIWGSSTVMNSKSLSNSLAWDII